MLTALRALWTTEPVRVATLTSAVIVAAAAKAGVILDDQDVVEALLLIVPILLGGEAARRGVSPARPPVGEDNDARLPEA